MGWLLGLVIDESTSNAIEPIGQYVFGYALKFWHYAGIAGAGYRYVCWLAARAAMSRGWICSRPA